MLPQARNIRLSRESISLSFLRADDEITTRAQTTQRARSGLSGGLSSLVCCLMPQCAVRSGCSLLSRRRICASLSLSLHVTRLSALLGPRAPCRFPPREHGPASRRTTPRRARADTPHSREVDSPELAIAEVDKVGPRLEAVDGPGGRGAGWGVEGGGGYGARGRESRQVGAARGGLLFAEDLGCPDGQEFALQSHDTPRADGERDKALRGDLRGGVGTRSRRGGNISVVQRAGGRGRVPRSART